MPWRGWALTYNRTLRILPRNQRLRHAICPRWLAAAGRQVLLVGLLLAIGCESGAPSQEAGPVRHARRARDIASARLAPDPELPPAPADVPAQPMAPADLGTAAEMQEILKQTPDPADETERLSGLAADPALTETERQEMASTLKRLETIRREEQVRLGLTEAVRRALQSSYAIQVQAYSPAIESTRIVEAEAQFDAVFFTNFTQQKQDRPSSSQLQGTRSDTRTFDIGVRKLLSAGTQAQISYNLTRTETNLQFQTLNPSYFNQFIVEFRQPLLRNFGLDFNRAQIELRRLDRAISIERLRQTIRETVFNVEQAYWRLQQARRGITVTARLLTDLETILVSLEHRLAIGFDVTPIELNLTRSQIEERQAEFIRLQNNLKNAEDALKRLINDPELRLGLDVEIIPTDVPSIEPMMVDQLGEVAAALVHRSELHEARLSIEQAQLGIGVAKNQALPRLDVLLRYIINGLGGNPHRAFRQMTDTDFAEHVLGIEFEWPIGNRGPEAALRRARLQQAQAIAAHRDRIEGVILDVNQAIRDLQSSYDQIGPSLRSALASQAQLQAIRDRMERRDPPNLEVELGAHNALAGARQQLIQVMADYNIGLVNLERQKGTLLRYNNIVVRGVNEEGYVDPYRPLIRP
jgi:outer membrane protein